jgi:glycerol uptake facilitator-like aquaporin
MNPARSFGPALVSGELGVLWIYVLGPVLGAALGAWAYRGIRYGGDERDAAGCC